MFSICWEEVGDLDTEGWSFWILEEFGVLDFLGAGEVVTWEDLDLGVEIRTASFLFFFLRLGDKMSLEPLP